MMKYWRELDLPTIPNNLLLNDVEDILQIDNNFSTHGKEGYTLHNAPVELSEYIQSFFDKPVKVRYQVITSVPLHTDLNRSTCFNYLINSGGPSVKTQWWRTENDQPKEMLDEIIFPENKWFELNVSIPHVVKDIKENRVAVTVYYA